MGSTSGETPSCLRMDSDHASSPVLTFRYPEPADISGGLCGTKALLTLLEPPVHCMAFGDVEGHADGTSGSSVSVQENSPAGENPGFLAVPAEPVFLLEIAALLGGLGERAQDSLAVLG